MFDKTKGFARTACFHYCVLAHPLLFEIRLVDLSTVKSVVVLLSALQEGIFLSSLEHKLEPNLMLDQMSVRLSFHDVLK